MTATLKDRINQELLTFLKEVPAKRQAAGRVPAGAAGGR
jgi:hypothetical protein